MSRPEAPALPAGDLPPEVCIASRNPDLAWGDRYVLVELIGEGGLGSVWKAWDRHLEKLVAIKRIRGRFDAEEAAAFMAEGRIVARLQHPNIATVFDIGLRDNEPFIVMQLVEGRTLADAGPWDPHRLAGVLQDVTRALEFTHRHGILHQDLKPENLMIEGERVVVLDFGISRLLGGSRQLAGRVGTPGFMSPEQEAGQPVDQRSDVFGLGATFRILADGRMPKEVDRFIGRCMAPDPARRFPSMAEIGKELKRLARLPARRARIRVAVGALVISCLVAGLAYWKRERDIAAAMDSGRRLLGEGRLEEAYAAQAPAGPRATELRKDILLGLNSYDSIWERRHHAGGVTGVGFTAGGGVSAGRNSKLRFWNLATGETVSEITAHEGLITTLEVSPDGSRVATGGEDRRVKLWDGATGRSIREWSEDSTVNRVRFSPDGAWLAIGTLEGKVRVCAVARDATRVMPGRSASVRSLAFSDGGALLAAGTEDGLIHVWDLARPNVTTRLLTQDVGWVRCLAFTPDATQVIAGYAGNYLRTHDLHSGRRSQEWMRHDNFLTEVFVRPGGAVAVTASGDRTLRFWDIAERKTLAILPSHPEEVLAFAVRGNCFLTGCLDGTVRLSSRRWQSGEVDGFPTTGTLVDLAADDSGRLHALRAIDGELWLESAGLPGERIRSLVEAHPGGILVLGPDQRMAVITVRLDGAAIPPVHKIEVSIRANGVWSTEMVESQPENWGKAGAWTRAGEFQILYTKLTAEGRRLQLARKTPGEGWSRSDLGPLPARGPPFSIHAGPAGVEMLAALGNPLRLVCVPVERDGSALSGLGNDWPFEPRLWKDRAGRIHGVALEEGGIAVFSETATGVTWRRIRIDTEDARAATGWSGPDGSIEVRWVAEPNRVRSARLPAQ